MKVKVNGETKEIVEDINLQQFIKNLSLPSERIAVELNERVVRKTDWENTKLSDADKIEIIHFVGGG